MTKRIRNSAFAILCAGLLSACAGKAPANAAGGAGMQAMPVQVENVALKPVPQSDSYVATIKSRRSATIQPQVDGYLTKIFVKSGDHVRAGQTLAEVDPLKQQAALESTAATQQQKKALYDYNKVEVERQKQLYESGVTSRDAYDQATQAYQNSKADYESSAQSTATQKQQLAYYTLRAPFAGVVGDIPVHLGDYVSPTTPVTTVDANAQLEAYVYIPTERASEVRNGLAVQIVASNGDLLESTKIYFVSPVVDNSLQGILVKAPIQSSLDKFRNAQLVKARVIWSTAPTPTVPVLSVTRIGGQAFVYVAEQSDKGTFAKQRAVTLGDTLGNEYPVISGLKPGDKVIISGTQFLIDGAPVKPLA